MEGRVWVGRTGLHGRKSLGRKEGSRVVDGTEGSGLDGRVCVWKGSGG
jgi:hypothetical protein